MESNSLTDVNLNVLFTGQQFRKLYERMTNEVSARYGLARMELDILMFLAENPDLDTARDIVELKYLAKSGISKAIDVLVKRGYLDVVQDPDDRRVFHLQLKEAAEAVIDAMTDVQGKLADIIFSGITPDEIKVLRNLSARISFNINRELAESR
ncbi:MAG: MarR family transcriptional regulator [Eubacteriaceae bacterium]|jgi:MarR family transcriptional regulator for hemolysin|nr:MarR family transcriptional regulator [Eubacteriaceae bacterium]